jgi:hypothetical protein
VTTYYYCDTKWHDNRKVPAEFLILPPKGEILLTLPNGFSACGEHVSIALKMMLEEVPNVIVREVNKETRNQSPEGV